MSVNNEQNFVPDESVATTPTQTRVLVEPELAYAEYPNMIPGNRRALRLHNGHFVFLEGGFSYEVLRDGQLLEYPSYFVFSHTGPDLERDAKVAYAGEKLAVVALLDIQVLEHGYVFEVSPPRPLDTSAVTLHWLNSRPTPARLWTIEVLNEFLREAFNAELAPPPHAGQGKQLPWTQTGYEVEELRAQFSKRAHGRHKYLIGEYREGYISTYRVGDLWLTGRCEWGFVYVERAAQSRDAVLRDLVRASRVGRGE